MILRRRAALGTAVAAGLWGSGIADPGWAWAKRRTPPRRDHRPLILIDPGHGGKDPGCIGAHGTQEKHVALAVGLTLRRHLLAAGHYRVAMTRETDVFISLRGRVEHARHAGAALLVSLHANASPNHRARGTCVYRFAWRASDAHAASLARWENDADAFEDRALRGASRQVLHILATLMRRETQLHSAQLQHAMVEGLRRGATMLPVPGRHARFAVLSAPDIAGVLVEMGFLTNAKEEKLLDRPAHQVMLAASMRRAVDSYFSALPHATHRRG